MAFEDLGDWAELAGLKLPISGKVYTLPPVAAELGVRIVAIMQLGSDLAVGGDVNVADKELLSDTEERSLYEEIFGPAVWAQALADGVPWPAIKHMAMTAMIDVAYDRDRAEAYWARLGKTVPAKKPARKPTDRQPRKATASKTTSASTGGTTRSRPRKSTTAAPRGRRSSTTGN